MLPRQTPAFKIAFRRSDGLQKRTLPTFIMVIVVDMATFNPPALWHFPVASLLPLLSQHGYSKQLGCRPKEKNNNSKNPNLT